MNGLFRAEVLRLTSRRLVRVAAVAFVGVLLLIQVVAAVQSKPGDAAMRAAVAEVEAEHQRGVEMCRERAAVDPEYAAGVDCESGYGIADDPRYRADEVLPVMATGVAVAAAIVAFVLGASYVGADWGAGMMQALLFWEPRRMRVVLVKALALVAVLVALTAVVQAVGWATTMLVAAARGTTDGVTSGLQQSTLLTMLRGMVLVTFTGLLGFAVSGLARVTGAALGGAFAYFAIIENLLRGLRPGWTRFTITANIEAVMNKGADVPAASAKRFSDLFEQATFRLTGVRGAVTLGIYLALLVGLFAVSFNRRDVT